MNRNDLARIARFLAALAGLLGLVAGLPALLAIAPGWPLPHALPTVASVRNALQAGWSPSPVFVVKALALVCWAAWAEVAACAVVEVVAAVRGCRAPRVPLGGKVQPWVAKLVGVVVLVTAGLGPARARPASLTSAAAGFRARPPLSLAAAPEPVPSGQNPSGAIVPASPQPEVRQIVVRSRDSLWDLAATHLGDPMRWREIWSLNANRPEPGGQHFVEPQLIRPGWLLDLPAGGSLPGAPAPTGSAAPHASASPSAHPAAPGSPSPAASAPGVPALGGGAGDSPKPDAEPQAPGRSGGSVSVPLVSGSIVATSIGAGIAAAVAAATLRRRRRYQPGVLVGTAARPPLGNATRRLLHARLNECDDPDEIGHQLSGGGSIACRGLELPDPGTVTIGEQHGEALVVDAATCAGVAISGAGADELARCIVVGLLSRGGPDVARVLMDSATAERLLPGRGSFPGFAVGEGVDDVLRACDLEVVRRSRLLDEEDVADFEEHRQRFPDDPLPAFVVVVVDPPSHRARVIATLGARIGIGLVVLGASPSDGFGVVIKVGPDGKLVHASGITGADGASAMHGLRLEEANELLGVLAVGRSEAELASSVPAAQDSPGTGLDRPVPASGTLVSVQLLGAFGLKVAGTEIRSGLRASARELVAYFFINRQGATIESVVDALWPDVDLEKGSGRFWTAMGNLRSRLRSETGGTEKFIDREGDRYRVCPGVFDVDLWRLEDALSDAHGNAARLAAAAEEYGGELMAGSAAEWLEPARESLRRRVLDALVRLSELRTACGDVEGTLRALERAIEVDPYAEDAYRRTIGLLVTTGRVDAARRLFRQLESQLVDIDAEPEYATARLLEGPEHMKVARSSVPQG